MMFVIKNRDKFNTNKDYYEVKTRQNINLHIHQVNLAIKVFNVLPYNLKEISNNPKKFKVNLKEFLFSNSFYSLEEFFKR
jgi:hypothetical protein